MGILKRAGAGALAVAGLIVIVLGEGSRSRSTERWKRPDKSGRFLFSIVS